MRKSLLKKQESTQKALRSFQLFRKRYFFKILDNNLLTYLKFDYFLTTLQKAEEHIANIEMYFED